MLLKISLESACGEEESGYFDGPFWEGLERDGVSKGVEKIFEEFSCGVGGSG